MRYLVVLEIGSPIGSIYANGNNDGFVGDGVTKYPVLDCTEISVDSPYYLYVTRDMSKSGESHQHLHIPHSSVVSIHSYAQEEGKPIGFIPSDNDS